jgi:hypothetical protein
VRLLLDSGADAFAVNSMGNTPLLQAEGNWRAVTPPPPYRSPYASPYRTPPPVAHRNWRAVRPRPLHRSADAARIRFADGALPLRRRSRDRRR